MQSGREVCVRVFPEKWCNCNTNSVAQERPEDRHESGVGSYTATGVGIVAMH